MHVLEKVINLCCANNSTVDVLKKVTKSHKKHDGDAPEVDDSKPLQPQMKIESKPETSAYKPTNKNISDKDAKFNDVKFDALPRFAKKSVEVLGFSEEQWNNHEWVESEGKSFATLSKEEQEAAINLGWDATAWDTQYEDVNWDDLPTIVISAAESCGFTQELWDNDEWPQELLGKGWNELSSDQVRAMSVLGHDKWTW